MDRLTNEESNRETDGDTNGPSHIVASSSLKTQERNAEKKPGKKAEKENKSVIIMQLRPFSVGQ